MCYTFKLQDGDLITPPLPPLFHWPTQNHAQVFLIRLEKHETVMGKSQQ